MPGVDGRRLVFGEHLLPELVGALRSIEAAFRLPLLDGVVVGDGRAIERRLEIGLRVRAAEEVAARRDLVEGLHAPGRSR